MFKSLKYFWSKYWVTIKKGKPNKRAFLIFLKFLTLELKCLFFTGYSIDEIF